MLRTGKLAYEWRGLEHLPALLDRLVADEVRLFWQPGQLAPE